MSNRVAVPDGQKDIVWMRDIEDRLKALETRQVQGNIAIDTLTVADLTYTATATEPAKVAGSQTWTQDVEFLGTTGVPPQLGISGQDALVTRNQLGQIQDISPHPFAQLAGGTTQSIASTTVVPITWVGASQFSSPYAAAATIVTTGGVLVVPVNGIYDVLSSGAWPNVVGTKGRVVIIQLSMDGGASWPTLFADGRSGINTASLGQDVACVGRSGLLKGWRLRTAVIQDEAGALNYVPSRFSFSFLSGYNA